MMRLALLAALPRWGRRLAACCLLGALSGAAASAALPYTGVNLAGAEFGENSLPGVYGQHYIYPNAAEVDYFTGKGANTFRLPFRWERLQRSLGAAFNTTEFNRLNAFVQYATAKGAYVVLDPHNYARYRDDVIGGPAVTTDHFADFWSRLAAAYKDNPRVIFGLMNEPHSMPTEQWLSAANAAIAAIRSAGATNLILVPGNAWTGAHSWSQNWYGTPNATVMLGVVDPGNNYAFDVHQYLDSNSSGGSDQIVSANIGVQRLAGFTNWLKQHNRRGFLGEFAAANSKFGTEPSQIGDEAIAGMLNHLEANRDVWLGWTWWAAGPWWGDYQFTLEPTNLGKPAQADRPAMALLDDYFAGLGGDVTGDYDRDGVVDGDDLLVWQTHRRPAAAAERVDGSPGASSASTAIPEPSAARLCMSLVLGVVGIRARLRRNA